MKSLIWKEILSELRTKQIISTMVVFGISISLVFALSFNLNKEVIELISPGLFWIIILFCSTLGINRVFSYEIEGDSYWSWIGAPIDRGFVFLSKVVVLAIVLFLSEILIAIPFFLFLNIGIQFSVFYFIIILVFGTSSILSIGCLVSGLALRSKIKGSLISVLLFPLTTPVIIAATKSTEFIFNQRPIGEWSFWLLILITISTVFCLTGYILFNYFIEE